VGDPSVVTRPDPDRTPGAGRKREPQVASVWAIVVAGGSGERFGGPKQFALLSGRPVVSWSIEAARSVADSVVLVVPKGTGPADSGTCDDEGGAVTAGGESGGKPGCEARDRELKSPWGADVVVCGGPTRSSSVRAGLASVPDGVAVVVVHDAARPLAAPGLFRAVVDAVVAGADGAVPGVPVGDTLKRLDGDRVAGTVDRSYLVAVQTPQAFRADRLRAAHAGGAEATDDAALLEDEGATVRVVPGDPSNVKLTTPQDLRVAEMLRS